MSYEDVLEIMARRENGDSGGFKGAGVQKQEVLLWNGSWRCVLVFSKAELGSEMKTWR